jgi:hypothetical protein
MNSNNQLQAEQLIELNKAAQMVEILPDTDEIPLFYTILKFAEYILLAAFIGSTVLSIILPEHQTLATYSALSISGFIFIFLVNKQLAFSLQRKMLKADVITKSAIQDAMMELTEGTAQKRASIARIRALRYCQELIDDYKRTRRNSRNIYYISQISTTILSGITPILVVVERLDSGPIWFKWLPVVFPAVAAIVSSIVTSFPFQEKWIEANKTVELLEAEQEKFILGITEPYRSYDVADTAQRQIRSKQSIENFIAKVNSIHLKQIQEMSPEKAKADQTDETATTNAASINAS